MAPNKSTKAKGNGAQPGSSFEELVRQSRKKKENEEFAQRIFGRDRRSSAPGALDKRSRSTDGVLSLASRVGIHKRSSQSNTNLRRENQAKAKALTSRPSALRNELQNNGGGELASRITNNVSGQGRGSQQQQPAAQNISIRGIAGPVTVMAQNFAPGTTAADIRSAFEPVGGEMLSCRLKASNPTVIAEMIFTDRSGADSVIETFNNQRADGRLLYVYLQAGGGVPSQPRSTEIARAADSHYPPQSSSRAEPRAWSDNERSTARAEPDYQDGRYGFENPEENMDVELDEPPAPERERFGSAPRRGNRGGYRSQQNGSYRDDRRYNDRYDRGSRQERGLYSDGYSREPERRWR